MRYAEMVLLLAAASMLPTAIFGKEPEMPRQLPEKVVDPESEARAAIAFLEKMSNDERPYIRLVSTYSVPVKDRPQFAKIMRYSFRHLTLSPNRRTYPTSVAGSDTLYWFDMRSFLWNESAWRAVALRDKAFREPWVQNLTARRLRGLIGEEQPNNFHVIAVIDAFGLYRRTYQTTETSDYYDLLFAEQRFPLVKGEVDHRKIRQHWAGGAWKGKDYEEGWYDEDYEVPRRKFTDFPKDSDDWFSAFTGGIDSKEYEGALKKLKSRRGAVCKGTEDAKEGVSFVARNNRLIWMAPALAQFNGAYGETFDAKKSSGKRDFEENAFTDQERDKSRVFRDGGELIFTLPAGDAIATLVINGQGKRLEEVPPDIAIHTRDSRDRRVRNGGLACQACHADAYGWIPFKNVIEDSTPDEIDIKFRDLKTKAKDRQAAEDYDAFFIGWSDELKPVREVMKSRWAQMTGTKANKYLDGMTGLQLSQATLAWKWRYDDPLNIDQMVLETGAPEAILRVAASRSTLRRAADVARKAAVPRPVWDEDVFPEVMKLLSAKKEKVTP